MSTVFRSFTIDGTQSGTYEAGEFTFEDFERITRQAVENKIADKLEEIEKRNEILIGLKELSTNNELERVTAKCEKFIEEFEQQKRVHWDKYGDEEKAVVSKYEDEKKKEESNHQELKKLMDKEKRDLLHQVSERCYQLERDYEDLVHDNIDYELGIKSFNIKGNYEKSRELVVEVLFYYLMKEENLSQAAVTIITSIPCPLTIKTGSWHYWIGVLTAHDDSFKKFYSLFDNIPDVLEYLICKRPQLYMNNVSGGFMNNVAGQLQYDALHRAVMSARDENGRTYMFYATSCSSPSKHQALYLFFSILYTNHVNELFTLLSVCDKSGQTALHVNTKEMTALLNTIYTSEYQNQISELLSIRDNDGKTALETSKCAGDELKWLADQVKKNQYVLNGRMVVLVIYSTNNRTGAQEEAEAIYNAFKVKYKLMKGVEVIIEKNKKKNEILELIQGASLNYNWPLSAFVVILASHGSVGMIEDIDGEPIDLKQIEETMCSGEQLKNRPKILITQCCQSSLKGADKSKPFAPTSRDFCAIMSSVAGQKSVRGVFLPKLADRLVNSKPDEDIFKIMSKVCAEMEKEKHLQSPIIMGTLKSKFCPDNDYFCSLMNDIQELTADLKEMSPETWGDQTME